MSPRCTVKAGLYRLISSTTARLRALACRFVSHGDGDSSSVGLMCVSARTAKRNRNGPSAGVSSGGVRHMASDLAVGQRDVSIAAGNLQASAPELLDPQLGSVLGVGAGQ